MPRIQPYTESQRSKKPTATLAIMISMNTPLVYIADTPTDLIVRGRQTYLNGYRIQGRYTWRHDSVLNCLLSSVRETLPATAHLHADIPTRRASESTIPTNISTTQARPDMVLIEDWSVSLLELTIPTNTYEALQAERNRKSRKPLYLQLVIVTLKTMVSQSPWKSDLLSTSHHML